MRAAGHATRERILAAAKAEFAEHGVAGARINRIAASAQASKDRLYAYFAGKNELYAAVTDQWVTETSRVTALDAGDLPAYAGRLFDHYLAHPDNARLQTWADIERTAIPEAEAAIARAVAPKLAELRRGQRAGLITDAFHPLTLLTLLTDLARTSALHALGAPESDVAERRSSTVRAAQRLIAP
ncbi:TetR family transcriptional regulator [Nocardia sp. NPDC005978]|uniref:TetR family transcriptional regulator n=1 Tax=unclassified Nocardia TaxID=2637762 RepID=UPI0033B7798F